LTTPLTAKLTRPLTGAELEELFLEKFKLTLSNTELVTNGDLSDGSTGWDVSDAGWSVANGKLNFSGSSNGWVFTDPQVNPVVGKTYRLSFDVSDFTSAGWNNVSFGGSHLVISQTSAGSYSYTITATSTARLAFYGTGGADFSLDNISVKEVIKQAPVAAFSLRKLGDVSPYAARIRRSSDNTEAQVMFDASNRVSESSVVRNTSQNLIPFSEDFGEWTLGTTPERIGGLADPFGGNNAWSIKSLTSGSYHHVSSGTASVTANSTHTLSWYVKKETSKTNFGGIALELTGGTTKYCYVSFDEVNGTITNTLSTTSNTPHISVTEPVSGWYRFAVTLKDTHSNNTINVKIYSGFSSNGTSLSAVAGSARTIFGAQLEETVTYESTPSITYSGDFNDDTGGWVKSENGGSSTTLSHETTNPISGSGSLKIHLTNTGSDASHPRVRVSMGSDAKIGVKYRVSFKAKLISGTAECDIRFGTATLNMLFAGNQNFTTTAQTYTLTKTFTTLAGGNLNFLDFLFDGTKGPFELLLDDVKVEEFDPIPSEYISTPVVSNDGLQFVESTLDDFVGGENLLDYSEDFSNNFWAKTDCTAVASNVTDPFGGTGAYKITETGTNAHLVRTSIATTGQVKSIYARTVSGTGVVDVLGVKSVARYGVTLTEEWQRFDFVVDTSESAGNHVYGVDFRSGDTTLTEVLLFGAQLNTDSLKKYQPTTGTARDGNASIVTLYNQTGGEDAIQATQAHQPLLYNAGLLVRSGSSPAIEFINSDPYHNLELFGQIEVDRLDAWFVADTADNTYIYPTNFQAGSKFGWVALQGANTLAHGSLNGTYGAPDSKLYANGTLIAPSGATRDSIYTNLNGRKLVHHQDAQTTTWTKLQMGWYGDGPSVNSHKVFGFTGKFSEWIFFDSNQSANRTSIEKDINDFHNIF
tara:strand:- start:2574 stop:5348 length:2775 start_codon:yes stop_codon:yes gene_type:complete